MVSRFFSLLLVGASFFVAPFVFAQSQLIQVDDKENWHNAAVSVASTEGFLYLDKFGVDLSTVSSSDDEVFVYVKAIDEFGDPVGFGHDGSVEIERFRFLGSLPQYVTDYSQMPSLECDKDLPDKCALVYPSVYDPELSFRLQLENTISAVAKDGGNIVEGKIGNTVTTVYPDADPETSTVDGRAYHNTGTASWATVRGATSAPYVNDSSNLSYVSAEYAGGLYYIGRGFLLFPTSSIPDTDEISSATLELYGNGAPTNADSTDLDIVSSAPASNTAIVTGDYDQVGSSVFSSLSLSSWNPSGYNSFSLDASGISSIDKTGITKFGARIARDTDNSAPSGVNTVSFYTADDVSNPPKLIITHTTPEAPVTTPATGDYDWYGDATIAAPDSDEGRWYWDWIITVLLVSMCCVVYVLKDNRSMIINN